MRIPLALLSPPEEPPFLARGPRQVIPAAAGVLTVVPCAHLSGSLHPALGGLGSSGCDAQGLVQVPLVGR